MVAELREEDRHDFHSTIPDSRATQSVVGGYAGGVAHLDDALSLWIRTLYMGKWGHPLESQRKPPAVVGLFTVRATNMAHRLPKFGVVAGDGLGAMQNEIPVMVSPQYRFRFSYLG